jgi:hypothetical protein
MGETDWTAVHCKDHEPYIEISGRGCDNDHTDIQITIKSMDDDGCVVCETVVEFGISWTELTALIERAQILREVEERDYKAQLDADGGIA